MVLCVTGPMASGKNQVSSILEKMGFAAIDADVVGHSAVEAEKQKILEAFSEDAKKAGISLLDENGKIIRRNLGALIFGNPEMVKKQESIVYPYITSHLKSFVESNIAEGKNVVINATVLFKTDAMKFVDRILYVGCPSLKRFFRARKRDGMKTGQILARFRAQKNLYKNYEATGIKIMKVQNTGSISSLKKSLELLLK